MGNLYSIKRVQHKRCTSPRAPAPCLRSVAAVSCLRQHLENHSTMKELNDFSMIEISSQTHLPMCSSSDNFIYIGQKQKFEPLLSIPKDTSPPPFMTSPATSNNSVSVARKTSAPPGFAQYEPDTAPPSRSTSPLFKNAPKTSVAGPSHVLMQLPGCELEDDEELGPLWEVTDSNGETFNFDLPGLESVPTEDLVKQNRKSSKN